MNPGLMDTLLGGGGGGGRGRGGGGSIRWGVGGGGKEGAPLFQ